MIILERILGNVKEYGYIGLQENRDVYPHFWDIYFALCCPIQLLCRFKIMKVSNPPQSTFFPHENYISALNETKDKSLS